MITIFTASRLKEPTPSYTVLLRTSGSGNVDVSLWLNDEQARRLGAALLIASEPAVPETTPETAA